MHVPGRSVCTKTDKNALFTEGTNASVHNSQVKYGRYPNVFQLQPKVILMRGVVELREHQKKVLKNK